MENKEENWSCHGWADHERGQIEAGTALSFRERLLWLQDADRLAAQLEKQRAWIDDTGVIHPARAE